MTGGTRQRLQKFIGNETCMLTYGDGLADIDIDALLAFHRSHGKLVTVSGSPGRPFWRVGNGRTPGHQLQGKTAICTKAGSMADSSWSNQRFRFHRRRRNHAGQEPMERAAAAWRTHGPTGTRVSGTAWMKRDHELMESCNG